MPVDKQILSKVDNTTVWVVKSSQKPISTSPIVQEESAILMKNKGFSKRVISLKEKLRKRTQRNANQRNIVRRSMHSSMRCTLLVCQYIGMFPVTGLLQDDSAKLRFSWWSFHFLYFMISLFGQFLMTFMCIYRMIKEGFNLSSCSNILFYGSSLISTMQFFRVARAWPRLMKQVTAIESYLPEIGSRVIRNCNWTTFCVLLFATAEHVLSILFGIHVGMTCSPQEPVMKAYFDYATPWIFDYLRYNNWLGVLSEVFNLQSTFMWNFTDVFIMVISIHLTAHFLELNKAVQQNKDQMEMSWHEPRVWYSRLARLVRLVDCKVSGLILISFSSNLFFICNQLFNSLSNENSGHFSACSSRELNKTLRGLEHSIYFPYSFSFLLLRALLVSLLAARVHSAARAPALALYDVPPQAFGVEVQRFLDQVNFSTVALSGLDFFFITRGMILTVVGTIVTYELVLLQFSVSSSSSGTPSPIQDLRSSTAQ